jgi:TRAP-type C4-dicarboxylate transport system permease small subunit
MKQFEKIVGWLSDRFAFLAGLFLVLTTSVSCINIFLRFFSRSLSSTYEITGILGALLIAFAIPYSQKNKKHVKVDVLSSYFSTRVHRFNDSVSHILCVVLFLLLTYQTFVWALQLKARGEVTETLKIVYYPMIMAISICAFVMAAVLLVDLLKTFGGKGEEKK